MFGGRLAITLETVFTRVRIVAATAIALAVVAGSTACASDLAAGAGANSGHAANPIASPAPRATPSAPPVPVSTDPPFNKNQKSHSDPSSTWVVVNKLRPLKPKTYTPADLVTVPVAHDNPARMRKVAASALVTMFAAGKKAGAGSMQIQSSFRSYTAQVKVYNGWVASLGKKQADRQSARPGFSEHQTGLAVDISPAPLKCALAACFGTTPQGKWLASHAWKYGYLLRYPADKTKITGYEYEPWHFRYIGVKLATELHKEHVKTLEEFFGLPPAPDYAK